MKKKFIVLLVLSIISVFFVACGVDYTREYIDLTDRYLAHVAEWDSYVETAEDGTDSLETIVEIDTAYDGIIAKIDEFALNEENMLVELESYVEGIDEESYTTLKESLNESLEISKEYRDVYVDNRTITKANLLYDQFYAVMDDWYVFCDGIEGSFADISDEEYNGLIDTTCTTNNEYAASLESIYNDYNTVAGDDDIYAPVSEEMGEIIDIVKAMTTELQDLKE